MCVHPPPKAEAASSNLAGCANLFNGLEIFSIFFENVFVNSLPVDYSCTTHATNKSPCPALNKAPIAHCLTDVFMP